MRPCLMLLGLVALAVTGVAQAHAPTTAIGRAVEAFGQVSVSYDPGSVVRDVEAGGFPQIVGSNPKVAFMPASAATEISGGPTPSRMRSRARPRSTARSSFWSEGSSAHGATTSGQIGWPSWCAKRA